MKLPITPKQLDIFFFLYKFRFLTTNHIQKLFRHKAPQPAQRLLKMLVDKEYIYSDYKRKEFGKNTKPAVFNLLPKAREILKGKKDIQIVILDRFSKESTRSKFFKEDNLFIADIYLILRDQTEKLNEKLHFSTKNNLLGYKHFPQPLPEAYIAIKEPQTTRRYFLFLIRRNLPIYALTNIIKRYIEYSESNEWQEHTNNTPLPSFLIICPTERIKRKIAQQIVAEYPEASFYVTTRSTIHSTGIKKETWENVNKYKR